MIFNEEDYKFTLETPDLVKTEIVKSIVNLSQIFIDFLFNEFYVLL